MRIKGKLTRITAEQGTAEFDTQYWEILSGKRADAKTSWTALIAEMRQSDKWANFSPRSAKTLSLCSLILKTRLALWMCLG